LRQQAQISVQLPEVVPLQQGGDQDNGIASFADGSNQVLHAATGNQTGLTALQGK